MVTEIYKNIDKTNKIVFYGYSIKSQAFICSCRNEWEKRKRGRFASVSQIRNFESPSNERKCIVKKW